MMNKWEAGLSAAEGVEIARRLNSRPGMIDFINVIRGRVATDEGLSRVIPTMGAPSAPHLDFAGHVRSQIRLPTFHAARIQDVATARHAIASGKLDMVAMTRAHMADPHIARKVIEGRESQIRPCVGMGYCIDFDLRRPSRLRPQCSDGPRGRSCRTRSRGRRARPRGRRRRRGPRWPRGGAGRSRARP